MKFKQVLNTFAALGLLAVVLAGRTARAEYMSSDNRIPSPSHSSSDTVIYDNGFRMTSFFDIFPEFYRMAPPLDETPHIQSFFDIFTEISLDNGMGSGGMFQGYASGEPGTGNGISIARRTGQPPGLPPGVPIIFDTEMLAMNISGGNLPSGTMIRESPSRPSLGRTTITDLGMGSGPYHIDSFFDVFTELSLDGGQSWSATQTPQHLTGTPEPSTLVLAGLGLAALLAMRLRRARRGR